MPNPPQLLKNTKMKTIRTSKIKYPLNGETTEDLRELLMARIYVNLALPQAGLSGRNY